MRRMFRFVLVCALLVPIGVFRTLAQASAQGSPQVSVEDVDLGDGALGRYRAPAGGVSPIAFLAIHRTNDFRNHQSAVELSNRGFGTLGIRTRFGGNEADVNFELIALDIRNGIRYLKNVKKHTRVILVGRSGGGPSTSYYQAVAENGVSYCKGPNKITECPFSGSEFTPADRADGIVYTDAHPGVSVNQLRSLNGAVVSQGQPNAGTIDRVLDPFGLTHGYNANGNSVYSAEFVDAYARAQSRRMNELIQEALRIKRSLAPGADAPFVITHSSARLVELSNDVQCCTLTPTRLLLDLSGTLSPPQIVRSVRVPSPGIKDADATGSETLTITSFLTANAIRSRHSLDDIDWCSSNNSTVCSVRSISVPTLVLAHQGHYFIRDSEEIYENAKSADKEFIVVEGATHAGGNCTACATLHGTGPYVNVLRNTWNYVATWARARF
jgi:hypothetical protein